MTSKKQWEVDVIDEVDDVGPRAVVTIRAGWMDPEKLRAFAEDLLAAATEIDGRETEISIVVSHEAVQS